MFYSKKEGRNYLVQKDHKTPADKINIRKTDKVLSDLLKASEKISSILKELYKNDYELYRLIEDEIMQSSGFDCDDGKSCNIWSLTHNIELMQNVLATHNDTIVPEEEIITLRDLGYQNRYGTDDLWELILEDTKEKEIIDEIYYLKNGNGKFLHRMRTTLWDEVPGGRSSREITYKNLKTGNRLRHAIENTWKNAQFNL